MILIELRDYVRERGQVSLEEVCRHFGLEQELARALLHTWVQRGRLRHPQAGAACRGCAVCASGIGEIYVWVEPAGRKGQGTGCAA